MRTPPETAGAPLAVEVAGLVKTYGEGDAAVHALRGVDVGFEHGAFTAIMGPSGSGKSTLMHCIAGLDTATRGSVRLNGDEITGMGERRLTRLRRDRIGFIFQAFNLLPMLTAEQNILLPLEIAGRRPDWALFDEVVEIVGLRDRLDHRPSELSGGQQQRVAVARAFVSRPEVVFADEPTGNLDSASGTAVLELLRTSVHRLGMTAVMVTHDAKAASYADRAVFLRDGRVEDEIDAPTADSVLAAMMKLEG
ncbi:ABC transporter ATP-binding protein [Nocardiopsis composta]|uniref:ABC transporter ATP-binding protein n=1 Tax=Nocardiopsis composta TaxID=157465 RepID=UPI001619AEA3|nr:ABC transporter ATP-binding protein [Nocardiopsis composta]